MFGHKIYESTVVNDLDTIDNLVLLHPPRLDIGTQNINRVIVHRVGKLARHLAAFDCGINAVFKQ